MLVALILTLFIVFALVVGWQIVFPLIGGAFVVTGSAWIILVVTVSILCAGILGAFIFAGIGILLFSSVMAIWTVLAIILFPVLLPILLPLLIIMLFISLARRKQKSISDQSKK